MSTESAIRVSARDRLLKAADELFYDEGIHVVGIDRVIERAGVAKASLYNTFGSKDALVGAYLQQRHARVFTRLNAAIERHTSPRERLLAVFQAHAEYVARPEFHGCAFANAGAEAASDSVVVEVTAAYRAQIRALLRDLAAENGVADPDRLAVQLQFIYDGLALAGRADDARDRGACRAAVTSLLDAALR